MIILHEQEAWAEENNRRALAAAIEAMSGGNCGARRRGGGASCGNGYAWPRVFDRLFSIYRRVVSDYKGARSQ